MYKALNAGMIGIHLDLLDEIALAGRTGYGGITLDPERIMEVGEEFGIRVHALVTVKDIYEYLKEQGTYGDVLTAMEKYMETYCIFE